MNDFIIDYIGTDDTSKKIEYFLYNLRFKTVDLSIIRQKTIGNLKNTENNLKIDKTLKIFFFVENKQLKSKIASLPEVGEMTPERDYKFFAVFKSNK